MQEWFGAVETTGAGCTLEAFASLLVGEQGGLWWKMCCEVNGFIQVSKATKLVWL